MTVYADSSALLKRYVAEPDSASAERLLTGAPVVVTSRITLVEVRRNLARLLHGAAALEARERFAADLRRMALVEVDAVVCELAAATAQVTGARSLDALHIGSARRLGDPEVRFVTFDVRQALAARAVGLTVLGV